MFALCVQKIKQVSNADIPRRLESKRKSTIKGPDIAEIKADKDDIRKIAADSSQIMQVTEPKKKFMEIAIPM
tara:strand:- start:84 stop:299 length:216 start_codon:yes stop_codon:yes gene_type:complete